MEGAVEFLSVECDMIFEPDCELGPEYIKKEEEEDVKPDIKELNQWNGTSPQSPRPIDELFRGRNVGVYCRKDPNDPFILIYDPTLHSREVEESSEEEKERKYVRHRCSVCRKQFRSHGCLVTHGLVHLGIPPGNRSPPCPVCGAVLPSRAALKIHVRRHFSAQTYQCPTCRREPLTHSELVRHQELHTTERLGQHQSNLIQTTNPKIQHEGFNKHNQTSQKDLHTTHRLNQFSQFTNTQTQKPRTQPAKNHAKPQLNKTHTPPHLNTLETLNNHSKRSRSNNTTNALPINNATQVSIPPQDIQCEMCGANFGNRASLRNHRRTHRDRRRRRHRRKHECPECGSQFWRSSALKKHRQAEHDV